MSVSSFVETPDRVIDGRDRPKTGWGVVNTSCVAWTGRYVFRIVGSGARERQLVDSVRSAMLFLKGCVCMASRTDDGCTDVIARAGGHTWETDRAAKLFVSLSIENSLCQSLLVFEQ